jgi:hypothetical protein
MAKQLACVVFEKAEAARYSGDPSLVAVKGYGVGRDRLGYAFGFCG